MSDRVARINALFRSSEGNSLEILHADFGTWPPRGIDSIHTPDIPVHFVKFYRPGLDGFVPDINPNHIGINRRFCLPHLFNKTSKGLADTASHENAHVLQNIIMYRQGFSGSIHLSRKHNYANYMKHIASPGFCAYNALEDEIQADLHTITAEHYLRTGDLPMNIAELWAMLEAEHIRVRSVDVQILLEDTMEGKMARKRFPSSSGRPKRQITDDVAGMNVLLWFVKPDRIDDFCMKVIPEVYGRLLELYGDRLGSIRMGANQNILLSEIFFRQAWRIEGDLADSRMPRLDKIEATLAKMPLCQIGHLHGKLLYQGGWKHPQTGKTHTVSDAAIGLISPLMRRHTAPPEPDLPNTP